MHSSRQWPRRGCCDPVGLSTFCVVVATILCRHGHATLMNDLLPKPLRPVSAGFQTCSECALICRHCSSHSASFHSDCSFRLLPEASTRTVCNLPCSSHHSYSYHTSRKPSILNASRLLSYFGLAENVCFLTVALVTECFARSTNPAPRQ